MATRIVLEKDYGEMKAGKVHIVTSTKLKELKKKKIKYNVRLKAGTGHVVFDYEKPDKENKEDIS